MRVATQTPQAAVKERNPFLSDSDSDDDMPAVVPMENLLGINAPPPAPAAVLLQPPGERNPFLGDSDSDDGVTAEEAAAAQRAMAARLRAETEQVRHADGASSASCDLRGAGVAWLWGTSR
jgi:hypothetical protein